MPEVCDCGGAERFAAAADSTDDAVPSGWGFGEVLRGGAGTAGMAVRVRLRMPVEMALSLTFAALKGLFVTKAGQHISSTVGHFVRHLSHGKG